MVIFFNANLLYLIKGINFATEPNDWLINCLASQ